MAEQTEKEKVRCNECKHLHIVNGNIVYAICKKADVIFERYKADHKEHFCEFGELKQHNATFLKEITAKRLTFPKI